VKRLFAVVSMMVILSIPVLTKANDSKKEAERYFSVYKSKRHAREFDVARRKLEAAIALDPDEPLYLYELAKLMGSRLPPFKPVPYGQKYDTVKHFMNFFTMFKESIGIYDRVAKHFPKYSKFLYGPDQIQYEMDNLFMNLNGSINPDDCSKEQRQYIRKVMKDYRKKAYPQMRKHYWKSDLSDGINSHKEYKYLFYFHNRPSRFYFFYDYEDQIQYAYQSTIKVMESSRDYLKNHPELVKIKQPRYDYAFWKPPGSQPQAAREWSKVLKNDNKLIKEALKHPNPQIRKYGEALAVLRGDSSAKTFAEKYPKSYLMKDYVFKSPITKKIKLRGVLKHLDVSGMTREIMNKYLISFVAADNCGLGVEK
jgi:hypothetical protein